MGKSWRTNKQAMSYGYTENGRLSNTNLTKTRDELRCSGKVAVPAALLVPIVLLLLKMRWHVMKLLLKMRWHVMKKERKLFFSYKYYSLVVNQQCINQWAYYVNFQHKCAMSWFFRCFTSTRTKKVCCLYTNHYNVGILKCRTCFKISMQYMISLFIMIIQVSDSTSISHLVLKIKYKCRAGYTKPSVAPTCFCGNRNLDI